MRQQSVMMWFTSLTLGGTVFLAIAAAISFLDMPSIKNIESCFQASLHTIYLCPREDKYIPIARIPQHVQYSLVVSEDASFFSHDGVDWHEMWQSMRRNIRALRWERGASTITQQLAKNLYLYPTKSLTRKFREFILARRIEKKLSKKQILEKYFNVVEFGPKIFGIKAAAKYYFGKLPYQLTHAEGAYLISLLPSPTRYSESFRKKRTLSKYNRQQVLITLERLLARQKISARDYDLEKSRVNHGLWAISQPQDVDRMFDF